MVRDRNVALHCDCNLPFVLGAFDAHDLALVCEMHPPPSLDPVPVAEQEGNPTIEQSST